MVFNICPCVGHFRFSEFRLYWWIRVLDSVKCPSFFTNYKAFSATKTPWVELCIGSVGEKDSHKILIIGAGTREMVSAGPDKTLEPFVSAFLCLALAWEALFDVFLWGRAWQRLPLKSRRAAGVVEFINTWSRSRLVCALVVYLLCLWPVWCISLVLKVMCVVKLISE